MPFRRDGDNIVLTLTRDQYDMVLIAIGFAAAGISPAWLRLADEINEGNPQYQPYLPPKESL